MSVDLTGKTFRRLTVTGFAGRRHGRKRYWHCRCVCGHELDVYQYNLTSGRQKSCGCAKIEAITRLKFSHGMCKTSVYRRWAAMVERCESAACASFKNYGGRGIKVCERWRRFENFYADMGEPPTNSDTLERSDNNGNYEPGNCQWVSRKVNNRNRRSNRYLTLNGVTHSMAEWCEQLGVSYSAISTRVLRGWTDEQTLTQPVKHSA